uniref:Cytochrome c oxidase subunit 6b-1-like n=1 Tax=Davidia involucrata TaxID=16924 RepID=A0A5B7ARE4_DAVIN
MGEVDSGKTSTLAEQYLLKEKEEKLDMGKKPAEEIEVKNPVTPASEEVVIQKTEETPVIESSEVNPAAAEESSEAANTAAGKSNETTPNAGEGVSESTPAAAEESSESTEQENSGDQEVVEPTPEIKLETAPADFRFPTTNQSRHCFTRYIEYHRCIAAKGEGAPECDKFAKYYRALCPGEWIDRWNEQRENGTFPGPL